MESAQKNKDETEISLGKRAHKEVENASDNDNQDASPSSVYYFKQGLRFVTPY